MIDEKLNPITLSLQCGRCFEELPEGESPAEYARIAVGLSDAGDFVVWCVRHDESINIFERGTVDETLALVIDTPCGGCGCKHGDKKESNH